MVDAFSIDLTVTACSHPEAFRRYDRNRILDAVKEQLTLHPDEETRNRKILRANPVADWELRVHPFRVFYDVNTAERTVRVVAVAVKKQDKLVIGGQEIKI